MSHVRRSRESEIPSSSSSSPSAMLVHRVKHANQRVRSIGFAPPANPCALPCASHLVLSPGCGLLSRIPPGMIRRMMRSTASSRARALSLSLSVRLSLTRIITTPSFPHSVPHRTKHVRVRATFQISWRNPLTLHPVPQRSPTQQISDFLTLRFRVTSCATCS